MTKLKGGRSDWGGSLFLYLKKMRPWRESTGHEENLPLSMSSDSTGTKF